ncbi:hypothetical protein SNEBB_003874 [Seison nebaliae]|nr:hypothetical protein SNEBB_003874 [Seison nebaliae]
MKLARNLLFLFILIQRHLSVPVTDKSRSVIGLSFGVRNNSDMSICRWLLPSDDPLKNLTPFNIPVPFNISLTKKDDILYNYSKLRMDQSTNGSFVRFGCSEHITKKNLSIEHRFVSFRNTLIHFRIQCPQIVIKCSNRKYRQLTHLYYEISLINNKNLNEIEHYHHHRHNQDLYKKKVQVYKRNKRSYPLYQSQRNKRMLPMAPNGMVAPMPMPLQYPDNYFYRKLRAVCNYCKSPTCQQECQQEDLVAVPCGQQGPCLNGGMCYQSQQNDFKCACKKPFFGAVCEAALP